MQRFVHPEAVISHFHIKDGDTVADFGAGSGYFLEPLTKAVGESGVLYACEIQKNLIETLQTTARQKNLHQVRVLWGDLEEERGIEIADGAVDVGVLINTLFQIEDKTTAIIEILRTIRAGGKIVVVDWTESFAGLGPEPGAVFGLDQARALFELEGCVFENTFDAGDHHYGVIFKKINEQP